MPPSFHKPCRKRSEKKRSRIACWRQAGEIHIFSNKLWRWLRASKFVLMERAGNIKERVEPDGIKAFKLAFATVDDVLVHCLLCSIRCVQVAMVAHIVTIMHYGSHADWRHS